MKRMGHRECGHCKCFRSHCEEDNITGASVEFDGELYRRSSNGDGNDPYVFIFGVVQYFIRDCALELHNAERQRVALTCVALVSVEFAKDLTI